MGSPDRSQTQVVALDMRAERGRADLEPHEVDAFGETVELLRAALSSGYEGAEFDQHLFEPTLADADRRAVEMSGRGSPDDTPNARHLNARFSALSLLLQIIRESCKKLGLPLGQAD